MPGHVETYLMQSLSGLRGLGSLGIEITQIDNTMYLFISYSESSGGHELMCSASLKYISSVDVQAGFIGQYYPSIPRAKNMWSSPRICDSVRLSKNCHIAMVPNSSETKIRLGAKNVNFSEVQRQMPTSNMHQCFHPDVVWCYCHQSETHGLLKTTCNLEDLKIILIEVSSSQSHHIRSEFWSHPFFWQLKIPGQKSLGS